MSLRADGGRAARAQVGLISHESMLYGALTARENVEFAARLYGLRRPAEAALRALEAMRVADRADAPVRALSRGLQQRVSIARAIVHEPRCCCSTSRTRASTTVGSAALTDMLGERRAHGAALLLVTHNVDEGLALATHAAIMLRGRFVRSRSARRLDGASYASAYRELVTADA